MTIKQIQCYGCSILCDDIFIDLKSDGVLQSTINSCFRGNAFIKNYFSENRLQKPTQTQMGLEIFLDMEETTSFIKKELTSAKSIKFYGLGALSYQDQLSVFLKIKELKKKNKQISISGLKPLQEILSIPIQSTIGEGINNADVFLFLTTDSTHSHPKLFGKLLFSRGMFRLSGKEMKKFILVQNQDSDLTRLSDILIDISQQNISQFVKEFEKLLDNVPLEQFSLGNLSVENLKTLRTYLTATEYGFIVCSIPISDHLPLEEFSILMQKLNSFVKVRFVFIPLTTETNEGGVLSSLSAVFGREAFGLDSNQSETDLAIVFGGEYLRDEYKPKEIEFREKNIILFDNFKSIYSKNAKITIPFAIPGIECNGTAIRMDGVNVDLKKCTNPPDEIKTVKEIFSNLEF